jgi:transcriptional regulator with XRE-family HTH domain
MNSPSNAKHQSTLSERIRVARRCAGLSQAALAKKCHVTASAVAQWEHPSGTRPDLDRLQGISTVTNVSLVWLVSGVGAPDEAAQVVEIEAPAVAVDVYAETQLEETLLRCFRLMSPHAQEHLVALAVELSSMRRKRGIQQRLL